MPLETMLLGIAIAAVVVIAITALIMRGNQLYALREAAFRQIAESIGAEYVGAQSKVNLHNPKLKLLKGGYPSTSHTIALTSATCREYLFDLTTYSGKSNRTRTVYQVIGDDLKLPHLRISPTSGRKVFSSKLLTVPTAGFSERFYVLADESALAIPFLNSLPEEFFRKFPDYAFECRDDTFVVSYGRDETVPNDGLCEFFDAVRLIRSFLVS